VVAATCNQIFDGVAVIARQWLDGPGDLEHRRRGFISAVSRQTGRSAQRAALIRLILTAALTAHYAGDLDHAHPELAASHLSALTFGQINGRSLWG
jgi:hypothetical protein